MEKLLTSFICSPSDFVFWANQLPKNGLIMLERVKLGNEACQII